ncbi:MAG: terminase large subunit [Dichotomicrobium sp.]
MKLWLAICLTVIAAMSWFDEAAADRAVAAYLDGPHCDPRPGFTFDRERAKRAVDFFPRYLKLTKGEWARRPFVLSDWQAERIIAPVFGWLRDDDGTRRYREVIIWVPRKNGKTELMGGVAVLHAVGDGEQGGEGYAIATKRDQAQIVFDVATEMLRLSPELVDQCGIELFKRAIWVGVNGFAFRPLSGIPTGEHGKGAHFVIGDEVHEWRDDRLHQFLRQGMGARRQPLDWQISTAGLTGGYGEERWHESEQIEAGIIDAPSTLVVRYKADADDDPFDLDTWRKANPNYGVSLSESYVEAEIDRARRSPRALADVKRYHLNIWVGQLDRWLPAERWRECGGDPARTARWRDFEDELAGRTCYGGVDLSATNDITALAWAFPPVGADRKWRVLVRMWLPKGRDERALFDKIRAERAPYDTWAEQGALRLTSDDAIDREAIKHQILEDCERFDVQSIGADPWNMRDLAEELRSEHEVPIAYVGQGVKLSSPAKMLERLVLRTELDHGGHPVLAWMADNIVVHQTAEGNIKPDKRNSKQKIDGIVAIIIALAAYQYEEPEEVKVSVYEERGLRVL